MLRMFGLGTSGAIMGGQTEGAVTEVKTCWWFKVNTQPVRTRPGQGALYPHILIFSYRVNGMTYTGKRWIHWNRRCPVKGEKLTVYYEKDAPEKYAVLI